MDSHIEIEGANYLSSREAGKIFGYSSDYISRLCRHGEVVGKKIGRSWYVEKASLEAFIQKNDAFKEERNQKLSHERKQEYTKTVVLVEPAISEPGEIVVAREFKTTPHPKVVPVAVPRENAHREIFESTDRAKVSLSVLIFFCMLGLGAFLSASLFIDRETSRSHANKQVSNTAATGFLEYGIDQAQWGASRVAQSITSTIDSVFDLFRPREVAYKESVVVEIPPVREPQIVQVVPTVEEPLEIVAQEEQTIGVIVEPSKSEEEDAKRIQQLQQSFSDEVEIIMKDDGSGIITPIFKEPTDDEYLFLMVPLQDS